MREHTGSAEPVYLDHAATTPLRREAAEAYVEAMTRVGNPASIHTVGQDAKRMLEDARETVAATLGCHPLEVVFTSGGTESVNLAIKGLFWNRNAPDASRPEILAPLGEHHATIETLEWLQSSAAASPRWLTLDHEGRVAVEDVRASLDDHAEATALVTLLWANNEVGTIQPVGRIAEVAADFATPLHVDAVAAYGHVPIDFARSRGAAPAGGGLSCLSVSAHKIGGPPGIGALVVSREAGLVPLVHGGGQQRRLRSGTENVPAACAFAAAARAALDDRETEAERLRALRDRLVVGVREAVPSAILNGPAPEDPSRLSDNAHFTFPGCEGDSLLFLLDAAGVCVSTGSACQAGVPEPSHVLLGMGRTEEHARASLRLTLGHSTRLGDVEAFLAALPEAYDRAAKAGPAAPAPR